MSSILIADSGGTKTDWALLKKNEPPICFQSRGIQPFQLSDKEIFQILNQEILPQLSEIGSCIQIFFYGAGCREEGAERVYQALQQTFQKATIEVRTDLLGAARALCHHCSGIVAILGTGANSGQYDGHQLIANVPPLGYILGDEGSGAILGRRLLGDIFKHQLPQELITDFQATYNLDLSVILQKVYREAGANKYLASFTPFLSKHRAHPAIKQLLNEEFTRFFRRNIATYGTTSLTVSFVGGIAAAFAEELTTTAHQEGYRIGHILKAPMKGLIDFHLSSQ